MAEEAVVAAVDPEVAVLDQKIEENQEVVEELEYAVDETAGEGGVVENLESIASSLEAILASGGALDAHGFRMFNHAMDSNLRRIGMDHKPTMPSMECFADPTTARGATRIALEEGVFKAIGDAIKKVWEWIKGVFRKIGEALGFVDKKLEKAEAKVEEAKAAADSSIKSGDLDPNEKFTLNFNPQEAYGMSHASTEARSEATIWIDMAMVHALSKHGDVSDNLMSDIKEWGNMVDLLNHDSIAVIEYSLKFIHDKLKDVPALYKLLKAANVANDEATAQAAVLAIGADYVKGLPKTHFKVSDMQDTKDVDFTFMGSNVKAKQCFMLGGMSFTLAHAEQNLGIVAILDIDTGGDQNAKLGSAVTLTAKEIMQALEAAKPLHKVFKSDVVDKKIYGYEKSFDDLAKFGESFAKYVEQDEDIRPSQRAAISSAITRTSHELARQMTQFMKFRHRAVTTFSNIEYGLAKILKEMA